MTCFLPDSRRNSTAPLIARLLPSVAPEVHVISLGSAWMSRAISARAASTASSACQPNTWVRLAALPNMVVKYGNMASTTRGSVGVVAA